MGQGIQERTKKNLWKTAFKRILLVLFLNSLTHMLLVLNLGICRRIIPNLARFETENVLFFRNRNIIFALCSKAHKKSISWQFADGSQPSITYFLY